MHTLSNFATILMTAPLSLFLLLGELHKILAYFRGKIDKVDPATPKTCFHASLLQGFQVGSLIRPT